MKNDPSHTLLRDAQELGHEARAGSGDHAALKLWLRLLACTTQIESEIRRRLRAQFGISLARFDYMAQLYRYKDGLKMRELSRYLMVTGGNVTGLTDDLERDGLVAREASPRTGAPGSCASRPRAGAASRPWRRSTSAGSSSCSAASTRARCSSSTRQLGAAARAAGAQPRTLHRGEMTP